LPGGVAAIATALLLSACEEQKKPGAIDTTIPEPKPASPSGKLSYPSDYIPDDLRVCAESVSPNASHCDARIEEKNGSRVYRLTVPPGQYRVYAQTSDMAGYKAYYTKAVICGLSVDCPDHSPVVLDVKPGESRNEVDPGDWYAPT
jgi:hypothetical protein